MLAIKSWPLLALAIILLVLLIYLSARKFFRKLGNKIPDHAITWRLYLRGQGTLVIVSLLVGGVLSWGSWALVHFGPGLGNVNDGGRLVELRDINPSDHPIYEEVDARDYERVTVITKVSAPENASAIVTIYDDQNGNTKSEIKRIDSLSSTWTRWDHANAKRNFSLMIDSSNQPGISKATKLDVLIYLSKK